MIKAKKSLALILAVISIFSIFSVGVFAADQATCQHNYSTAQVEADCTNDGGLKYTCSLCGYEYLENPVAALGHEDADSNNECDRCGESMKQSRLEKLFQFLVDFIRWLFGMKD